MSRASAESERAVAIAWRRVLGEDPVPGVTFLEAAGDLLQLLTLLFALESRVGGRLSLEAFTAETDATGMAQALDAALAAGPAPSSTGGIFLLPGARGDTPGLAGVRADCAGRILMEMLAYPGWRAMAQGRLGLEDIAATLEPTLAAAAAQAPVTLIGYSLGAQLAGILAFRLEAAGLDLHRLVIIDMPTPAWAGDARHVWSPPCSLREAWWDLNRLARKGTRAERAALVLGRLNGQPALRPILRFLAGTHLMDLAGRALGTLGYWSGHHLAQEMRFNAAEAWTRAWHPPPHPLRAPVFLIRTAAHRPDAPDDLGWAAIAADITVTQVPGDHISMLSAANRRAVSAALITAMT